MYTINIRGKQNPKDQKMVKLEMIFFKTGYARVPKVLNVTGLLKDWDAPSQSFRVGSSEATTKNKLLFDLRTKYLNSSSFNSESSTEPTIVIYAFFTIPHLPL